MGEESSTMNTPEEQGCRALADNRITGILTEKSEFTSVFSSSYGLRDIFGFKATLEK